MLKNQPTIYLIAINVAVNFLVLISFVCFY